MYGCRGIDCTYAGTSCDGGDEDEYGGVCDATDEGADGVTVEEVGEAVSLDSNVVDDG